jgi:DUF2934 family protein
LRLLKSGDVRIGRLFISRRTPLDLTSEGVHSLGISMLRPGLSYYLSKDDLPLFKNTYNLLVRFDNKAGFQNIRGALHSFNSIYDRQWNQGEDQLVDAITALEGLFAIDLEHTFKLAFRAAALLTYDDDSRVRIFNDMRTYYRVRSAVVHGSELKPAEKTITQDLGSLKTATRRLLLGFLRLADERPELGKKKSHEQFYKELDGVLQHSIHRTSLRTIMGLTDIEVEVQGRAYELYEQRRGSNGTAEGDWLRAESEITEKRVAREKSPSQQWFEAMAQQNAIDDLTED